jgi:hypothetical protein
MSNRDQDGFVYPEGEPQYPEGSEVEHLRTRLAEQEELTLQWQAECDKANERVESMIGSVDEAIEARVQVERERDIMTTNAATYERSFMAECEKTDILDAALSKCERERDGALLVVNGLKLAGLTNAALLDELMAYKAENRALRDWLNRAIDIMQRVTVVGDVPDDYAMDTFNQAVDVLTSMGANPYEDDSPTEDVDEKRLQSLTAAEVEQVKTLEEEATLRREIILELEARNKQLEKVIETVQELLLSERHFGIETPAFKTSLYSLEAALAALKEE